MSLQIRSVRSADLPAINQLVNAAYRGETARRTWTSEADLVGGQRIDLEVLAELFARPDSQLLVAERAGQIVGCVHVERLSPTASQFGMLTVSVTEQKKGIGDFLVAEAERHASKIFQSAKMQMNVITVRSELIAWYQKRGYRITEQRTPFPYGNERVGNPLVAGLEFLVMKKDLSEEN